MTPSPANPTVQDLADGKPEAYAALYDGLGRRMLRVAATMLNSRTEAEDAVQDVFVSLVRARQKLALVRDLEAYVFAALRHAIGQRAVRQKTERRNLDDLAAQQRDHSGQAGALPDLDKALATLPAEQRQIVALKIDGQLTFAQIGEVLAINPNTAASRYRYALEKMRATLEKDK
jgi:RNA polymerase sigma-70 factor, ECF subfamily